MYPELRAFDGWVNHGPEQSLNRLPKGGGIAGALSQQRIGKHANPGCATDPLSKSPPALHLISSFLEGEACHVTPEF